MTFIKEFLDIINSVDGVNASRTELLNEFYRPLIKKNELKYNNKYIHFTDSLTSKIIIGERFFNKKLLDVWDNASNINLLSTNYEKNIKGMYFIDVNEEELIRKIKKLLLSTQLFKDCCKNENYALVTMYNLINNNSKNSIVIAASFNFLLYTQYCDFIIQDHPYSHKTKNPLLIGKIIETIMNIDNNNLEIKKYKIAYSLEDKMNKNKLSFILQNKIDTSFKEDYDIIMTAIEQEDSTKIQFQFYRIFRSIYFDILAEMDLTNESDIINNSDFIFKEITKRMLDLVLKNSSLNVTVCDLESYVFSICVFVFYKCKFLVSMEEDKHDN